MDNQLIQATAALRKRFRYFLSDTSPRKQARRAVVSRLDELGWDACVFGGTLRDIALFGPYAPTRDIDIVVAGVGTDDVVEAMKEWLVSRNSFGGVRLNVNGTLFDIWPLHETWAFKHWGVHSHDSLFTAFSVLPATTFLTVESVVLLLRTEPGLGRRIYERGFFQSVANRVVELNRPENPYPALCVARAVATALRLDFRLGPLLARYLIETLRNLSLDEVVAAQRRHYRSELFSAIELDALRRHIEMSLDRDETEPVELIMSRQLEWPWARPDPVEEFLSDTP